MSDARLRGAIAALAVAGVGVTAYLVAVRYSGGVALCTSGGCETVQHSSYSKVAGVPVALLGLVGYLAILASAFLHGELARLGGAAVALAGLAFGLYLVYVQVSLIGATCDWCLSSDGLIALLAVLTVLRVLAGPSRGARP